MDSLPQLFSKPLSQVSTGDVLIIIGILLVAYMVLAFVVGRCRPK